MNAMQTGLYTVTLTAEELGELQKLLEQALEETHLERRRTEAPAYHANIVHEESVIRGLVEKVRQCRG
jgi:hypothetical protein